MRANAQTYMYTIVLLIITTSKASTDNRETQNLSLNDIRHIQQITGLVITRAVPYTIPQPYQVTVEQEVPYPVKVPVGVPIDRPYEVHIPKPFTVPVIRPVPVPVHRLVPYPVHVPLKNEDHLNPSTPQPPLHDFQHKPHELHSQIEYDLATSLSRPVPVRSPQPTLQPTPQPSPPAHQPTSFLPAPAPTTSEPSQNPFGFNILDAVRYPGKPTGPLSAISFQAHRPYAGFNLATPQFTEHHQHSLQSPQPSPAEPFHQQPAVFFRRPAGFNPDPSLLGAYQHQPIPEPEPQPQPLNDDISDEPHTDIIANFAEGALFNLNNRLRRRSSSRSPASTATTTKKTSPPTTSTTVAPPKKT